jgi:succinyl-CoA synthetase beta subunit
LEEGVRWAGEIGYPIVLKALGALHKSDVGGVIVGIRDEEEFEIAFSNLQHRLSPTEFSVEETIATDEGVELIIGARRDRRFGSITVVGLGGIYTEIFSDSAVALAPVDEDEARRLLLSLRAARLLTGARGRAPLALNVAARAVVSLSALASAYPGIKEIEVNPLLVTRDRTVALDARAIVSASPRSVPVDFLRAKRSSREEAC